MSRIWIGSGHSADDKKIFLDVMMRERSSLAANPNLLGNQIDVGNGLLREPILSPENPPSLPEKGGFVETVSNR